ncbi:hypothetical protein LXL04_026932 [Taraxacum kok-saghyz]
MDAVPLKTVVISGIANNAKKTVVTTMLLEQRDYGAGAKARGVRLKVVVHIVQFIFAVIENNVCGDRVQPLRCKLIRKGVQLLIYGGTENLSIESYLSQNPRNDINSRMAKKHEAMEEKNWKLLDRQILDVTRLSSTKHVGIKNDFFGNINKFFNFDLFGFVFLFHIACFPVSECFALGFVLLVKFTKPVPVVYKLYQRRSLSRFCYIGGPKLPSSRVPLDISSHKMLSSGHSLQLINIIKLQLPIKPLQPCQNDKPTPRRPKQPIRLLPLQSHKLTHLPALHRIKADIGSRVIPVDHTEPVTFRLPCKRDDFVVFVVELEDLDWDVAVFDAEELESAVDFDRQVFALGLPVHFAVGYTEERKCELYQACSHWFFPLQAQLPTAKPTQRIVTSSFPSFFLNRHPKSVLLDYPNLTVDLAYYTFELLEFLTGNNRVKTSAVCGPHLQSSAEEEVVQTSAAAARRLFFCYVENATLAKFETENKSGNLTCRNRSFDGVDTKKMEAASAIEEAR